MTTVSAHVSNAIIICCDSEAERDALLPEVQALIPFAPGADLPVPHVRVDRHDSSNFRGYKVVVVHSPTMMVEGERFWSSTEQDAPIALGRAESAAQAASLRFAADGHDVPFVRTQPRVLAP